LREHRGATHGLAVVAAGLDPLTAILADSGGEENAIDYGWSPPFAVVTDLDRERRRHAEELTDALVTPAFEVLSATERAEFLILLDQAYEHVFRDRPPAGTGVSPIVSGDA
jgi:hypothetical protein